MPNNNTGERSKMSTSRGFVLNAYQRQRIADLKKVLNISLVMRFIRLENVRLTQDKFFRSVNGNI